MRRFGAAGDHHVGIVVLNGLQRVAHGVGGAGAGGGHGIVRSAQTIVDGNVAAGGVDHQLGNREGRNLVGAFVQQAFDLRLDLVQAADAGAQDDARSGTALPW